jgi:hypothetical protein
MRVHLLLLLLLGGCSFGLGATADTDEADTTPTRIDAITPAFGPASGGTTVTITGAGFVGDVKVTFAGLEASSVTVIDTGTLTAVTPNVGSALLVDVKVISDNGADTLAAGFQFRTGTTTTDDTGDTGGDTDVVDPYEGMTAGLVTFDDSEIACPTCFGDFDGDGHTVTATAKFHDAVDGSWFSALPAEGACVSDAPAAAPATTWLDAGTAVTLTAGGSTITMYSTAGPDGFTYAATGLTSADYVADTPYVLTTNGGADIESITIPDTLTTTEGFTSVSPTALMSTDTSGAFSTNLTTSGQTITWSPSGSSATILVTLVGRQPEGVVGTTVCRGPDNGSIAIPASAYSSWPQLTQVTVALTRYRMGEAVLPTTGASIEVASGVSLVGTATVRN